MIVPSTKVGDLLLCQTGGATGNRGIILETGENNIDSEWLQALIIATLNYDLESNATKLHKKHNFWNEIKIINPQDLILYSYFKTRSRYWKLLSEAT
jgi:hypothetical protein